MIVNGSKSSVELNQHIFHQLSVKGLYAGYRGRFVVEDVNLKVVPGEVIGLIGHNGSGKSTVLLGIAGLISHFCDSLSIGRQELCNKLAFDRMQSGIGILLQHHAVFPGLTVDTNMQLAGFGEIELRGNSDVLNFVDRILKRREALAGTLSGGERKVLGLLMVLSGKPKFLLADEPTLGLAQQLERGVISALQAYVKKEKCGVVLVSHNLSLIRQVCDRVYILKKGRIDDEVFAEEMRQDLDILAGLLQDREVKGES